MSKMIQNAGRKVHDVMTIDEGLSWVRLGVLAE
jgi:hypothetical protein